MRMGILCCLLLAATLAHDHRMQPAQVRTRRAPINHVFVIVLENNGYDETFGPNSPMPYLSTTLTRQGALLRQYYATAHVSLPNYIAMVSGQGPNAATQSDCQLYADLVPGVIGPDGQAIGSGCVYPSSVKTVADQLEERGLSWKAYLQDMETPCRHPALNSHDESQQAKPGDQYATRHNPYVYFHSVIDRPACAQRDVDLAQLPADLAHKSAAPQFSMIVPDLCEDGHDAPCVDGRPGGPAQADAFLQTWVPRITSSPALKDGGLLAITFDEAENADSTACCGETSLNSPMPGITGPGGGRIGMVLLGPSIPPGTFTDEPANHYSFLRTIEDLFALDHLGYAATVSTGLPLVVTGPQAGTGR
jgi:phospholipase C